MNHPEIGSTAFVEMPVKPCSDQTHFVPCTIVATHSADDRPYRVIVRLEDGRVIGPCAPECVLAQKPYKAASQKPTLN